MSSKTIYNAKMVSEGKLYTLSFQVASNDGKLEQRTYKGKSKADNVKDILRDVINYNNIEVMERKAIFFANDIRWVNKDA